MGYIKALYLLATLAISSIASARACTKVCLDNCSGAGWARYAPKMACLESLSKCNKAEIRRKSGENKKTADAGHHVETVVLFTTCWMVRSIMLKT